MGLIVEYLRISYELVPHANESAIRNFLEMVVIPEVNSINSEEPEYIKAVPNQANPTARRRYAYFDCGEAFDCFYEEPAMLSDLERYEIRENTINWKSECENTTCDLTRYLAWKIFCEFGIGDTFESTATYQDKWDIWQSIHIVGRDALILGNE
jgi:hypothetical protein